MKNAATLFVLLCLVLSTSNGLYAVEFEAKNDSGRTVIVKLINSSSVTLPWRRKLKHGNGDKKKILKESDYVIVFWDEATDRVIAQDSVTYSKNGKLSYTATLTSQGKITLAARRAP